MKTGSDPAGFKTMTVEDIASVGPLSSAGVVRKRVFHCEYPSAGPFGRHVREEFRPLLAWLTIRPQNDRLGLP
jgi:hypothetical protein